MLWNSTTRIGLRILAALMLLFLPVTNFSRDIPGLKHLEYGILDYGEGEEGNYYEASGEVYFLAKRYAQLPYDKPELYYKIEPAYNAIVPIRVINEGGEAARVGLNFESPDEILMGVEGPGASETPVEIPPRQFATIPITLFAQDAKPGFYQFSVNLTNKDNKVLDRIRGTLYVEPAPIQVSIKKMDPMGLSQIYELTNEGGPLYNATVSLEDMDEFAVSPQIDHYLWPSGETIRVSLFLLKPLSQPRAGNIVINSSGVVKKLPVEFQPPRGMQVGVISIDPVARLRKKDYYCTNRPIIHLDYDIPYMKMEKISGASLNPQWLHEKTQRLTKEGRGLDTSGDGKLDHWELLIEGEVVMAGDDYDGDGSLDFLREADTEGRTLNRAYLKKEDGWYETNVVSAYLVSSFLPLSDVASVKPHEVNILLNKSLINRQTDIVPTGSSIYRLRVDKLQPPAYTVSKNRITVSTVHMRSTSYQVSSENSLIVHYSVIDVPALNPSDVFMDTSPVDRLIREKEEEIRKETNPTERELMETMLQDLKKKRDLLLQEMRKVSDMNFFEVNGIYEKGLDLAVFSNETQIKEKKIIGSVHNLGYTPAGYEVLLLASKNGSKFKFEASEKYPPLPPFARRSFELALAAFDPRSRAVYKIEVKALAREEDTMPSNNQAHLVSGPVSTDMRQRRSEARLMAEEMGVTQDQTTLVRNDFPLPTFADLQHSYEYGFGADERKFTSPISKMDDEFRVFIIE